MLSPVNLPSCTGALPLSSHFSDNGKGQVSVLLYTAAINSARNELSELCVFHSSIFGCVLHITCVVALILCEV